VDIVCFQETNVNWNPAILHQIRQILLAVLPQRAKIVVSQSKEHSLANYKPGGMSTIVLGPHTTHAWMDSYDPHGLGRWSYLEFEGSNDQWIVFVTGYRSCNQPTQLGLTTYHNQQYRLLLEAGHVNPNPREKFLDDIILQIQNWRAQWKAVLVCMDANDDVCHMNLHKGIGRISTEMDLVDLHHLKFPNIPWPPTHTRGSLTIDICLGSPEFVHPLTTASILPFGQPSHIHGDHCTLLVEFDSHMLFGNATPTINTMPLRGVYSNTIPIVHWFCQLVGKGCDKAEIANRIAQIKECDNLTDSDREHLDKIDRDISKILTWADRKCWRFKEHLWSLTLQQDYLVHQYWTVKLSEVKTK